jgi:cysteinyl-tRNA synthetase
MASSTTQPPWTQPKPAYSPAELNLERPLKVFNSLTRSKDTFYPEKKDEVSW